MCEEKIILLMAYYGIDDFDELKKVSSVSVYSGRFDDMDNDSFLNLVHYLDFTDDLEILNMYKDL